MLMLLSALVACGKSDDDMGAIINMYIGDEIRNYDPAIAYTDESAVKFFELIYEGLFDITAGGKVEKTLCKNYRVFEEDGETVMEIELIDSRWSDGRAVSVDEIIFAWKRILDPEFASPAAALLYDIKNAKAVKEGLMSIDDLGVYAEDTKIMQIYFEDGVDTDLFIETLASPALVPLREDQVSKGDNWSTAFTTISTNGPFTVKSYDSDYAGKTLILERSIYYHTVEGKEGAYDKHVTPHRIVVNFGADAAKRAEAFANTELFFSAGIGADVASSYKKTKTTDLLSTYTYLFNTQNPLFSKAEVRRALSMALDRNAIAALISENTVAATGLVPNGVYDTKAKTSFRKEGGSLISASADLDAAKTLLKSAGVSGGSFTVTYNRSAAKNKIIAEYVKSAWEALGFKVTLNAVGANKFSTAYNERNFDVIGIDYQALSTSAWSMLAPLAYEFAGNKFDMSTSTVEYVPHVSGYASSEYNALISSAYAAKDRSGKAEYLHEAEAKLIEDMPVLPVVFNVDTYATQKLSGFETNAFGVKTFTGAKQSSYQKYLPVEE